MHKYEVTMSLKVDSQARTAVSFELKQRNKKLKNSTSDAIVKLWETYLFDAVSYSISFKTIFSDKERPWVRNHKSTVNALIEGAVKKASSFSARAIAETVNTIRKHENRNDYRQLFIKFKEELLKNNAKKLHESDQIQLANILASYQRVDVPADDLFSEAGKMLTPQILKEMQFSNLLKIVYALCSRNAIDKNLYQKLQKVIQDDTKDFSTIVNSTIHDLIGLAWFFALHRDTKNETLFKKIINRIFGRISFSIEKMDPFDRIPFLHLTLFSLLQFPEVQHPENSKDFYKKLIESLPEIIFSQRQTEVCSMLKNMLEDPIVEKTYIDCIPCDIVADNCVVVQVFDESHYIPGTHTLNLQSLFQVHMLHQMNYGVIVVPPWEWDALRDTTEKEEYIKTRMNAITQVPYEEAISLQK